MRIAPFVAAAILLAGGTAVARDRSPQAQLDRALAGRVAGKPVDCIQLRNVQSSRVIDHIGIIYDTGRTLYLNRPRSGAQSLDWNDILVTKTYSSQLCSVDTVNLVDRTSRFPTGFLMLGKFVPYTKPPKTPA